MHPSGFMPQVGLWVLTYAMQVLAGAIEGAVEGFSEAAAVRCLAAAAAGGSAATREALR